VSHDTASILRPLSTAAPDVAALRAGGGSAAAVVRVARAAEAALRRMLRDDPTAPVELRLRALSPDDLPGEELLAELRRRDRLPMELAASFHELAAAAARLASEGGEAAPRDRELALGVAEGLERHVRSNPFESPLEDPVLAPPDETLIPHPEDAEGVHPVPSAERSRQWWPWAALAGALALVLLAVVLWRGRGDPLAEGESAYRRGELRQAAERFREAAREDPEAPLPRFYLAQIFREGGRYPLAAEELRAGLAHNPDHPGLNTELGFLLLDSGRPNDAVERLTRAVKLDPNSARAWVGLVRALRASGRPAAAEAVLRRAPAEVRALLSDVRPSTP
jgi:tetratricopeptide (TPR) repeat protein